MEKGGGEWNWKKGGKVELELDREELVRNSGDGQGEIQTDLQYDVWCECQVFHRLRRYSACGRVGIGSQLRRFPLDQS